MIALILDDEIDGSPIPDCVALATIERLAADQAAALLHATATGGTDEAGIDVTAQTTEQVRR